MTDLKLMNEEDGCYLSLAVAMNSRAQSTIAEIDDIDTATSEVIHLETRTLESTSRNQLTK